MQKYYKYPEIRRPTPGRFKYLVYIGDTLIDAMDTYYSAEDYALKWCGYVRTLPEYKGQTLRIENEFTGYILSEYTLD